MAKCQWKVDWAMRWVALGVDYEMYGKDLTDSGIQSGKILRLRGKGIPSLRDKTPGDQLIRVVVVIPTKLTAEQRALYESLAEATGEKPPKFAKGFFEKVRDAFTGT